MNILILGGDGYLGWPTAMDFALKGNNVMVVDNYYRRKIAEATNSTPLMDTPLIPDRVNIFKEKTDVNITFKIGDLVNYEFLKNIVESFKPDTIIHYAEQPSAPYSMMGYKEARDTLNNNLNVTFNCIWAIIETCPQCHLVKLGTMGEYGTPNIDIEEGWIEIEHNKRRDTFLYPRSGASLYHTTKILDTDLLWFYVRLYGLKVTDLMQGPVYGLTSSGTELDPALLPNFHYDDIFGTVVNRFLVQACIDIPLTVYGKGNQTRGYLNLIDTLQCVNLACENPPVKGELKILNQFTETFSVLELAEKVKTAGKLVGLSVDIKKVDNPRKEKEDHYYNPKHSGLIELGLVPTLMTEEILVSMLERLLSEKGKINKEKILPRVVWNK